MSTDLQPAAQEEQAPKKAPGQILRHEIAEGIEVLHRTSFGLFVSGLSAGLDIGFSLLLMAVMWSQVQDGLSKAVVRLLVANMYAVGFIFVVIGRSELFTEQTTLAVLPFLDRKTSLGSLARLWGTVYVSNLVGAAAFAALLTLVGPALSVVKPQAFAYFAHRTVDHPPLAIFLSALLAGWLMGLLSWLVAAGRDTISQIVIVWLITTSIGFAGLHHSIVGSVEVLAGLFAQQGIGVLDFGKFLLWSTLGNAVGGSFFVALIKYGHARPEARID